MAYKGVIFDLDGTLINTLEDLTDSMNYGLAELGCPHRSAEECRRMIGDGLKKYAERALPEDRQHLRGKLIEIMVAHYQQHCLIKTAPYEGMTDVIQQLEAKGIRMAVLTNKNQKPSEILLKHFWKEGTFDPIFGIVEGRRVKPNPESTLEILKQWQLTPSEAIFVGDSEVDIQTAHAAGVTSVGCEWGFRNKEQLLKAGAKILIREPIQILAYLD